MRKVEHQAQDFCAPQYGQDEAPFRTIRINLAVARSQHELPIIAGSFLWAYTSTSLIANIDIHYNNQSNDPINFRMGMMVRGKKFSKLFVTNAAQAGETITLAYAKESIEGINIENPAVQYTNVTVSKASGFAGIADKSCLATTTALLVAANAARRGIFVSNEDPAVHIRIGGDGSAGAAQGKMLHAGESVYVPGYGALYYHNPNGNAVTVTMSEVVD